MFAVFVNIVISLAFASQQMCEISNLSLCVFQNLDASAFINRL